MMRPMSARGSRVVVACILLIGCGGGVDNGGDGGGIDATTEDAAVGGGDAGTADGGGAAMDAGVDASIADAGPDASAAMDAGPDAGRDGGPPITCPAFMSPAVDWSLPKASAMGLFPAVETLDCPSSSSPRYTLLDMDGDGLDDLVVTSSCGGGGELGVTHWDVYLNTGSGFAGAPTTWTLPTSGYIGGFHELASTTCPTTAVRYHTLDLDGDQRPDLVVTGACAGVSDVGNTHWVVHWNNGSGFDTSGFDFPLPTGYTGGFHDIEAATCTPKIYTLLDTDGDRDPDLVVTALCDGTSNGVGTARWLVHTNAGNAFAGSSVDFTLPSGYPVTSFQKRESQSCPSGTSPRFVTTDLDGDRVPDLVVTSLCSGGMIGRAYWAVHLGTAAGFDSTATMWTLPSYTPGAFTTFETPPACTPAAQPRYVVRDIDGDDAPDLIVTGLCSGGSTLGRWYWYVHINTGTGFGDALSWALPPDYPGSDFTDSSTVSCAGRSSPRYDVRDMNGDGILDFVATSLCSGEAPLGRTEWAVHLGCVADSPF